MLTPGNPRYDPMINFYKNFTSSDMIRSSDPERRTWNEEQMPFRATPLTPYTRDFAECVELILGTPRRLQRQLTHHTLTFVALRFIRTNRRYEKKFRRALNFFERICPIQKFCRRKQMKVNVFIDDQNRVILRAPYHPKWPKKARDLGGIFRRRGFVIFDGAFVKNLPLYWVFDERDIKEVKKRVKRFFGTCNSDADRTTTLSIKIMEGECLGPSSEGIFLGPCEVVKKEDFGNAPNVGEDIVLLEGTPDRYCNKKFESFVQLEGPAHFEVRDIPTGTADRVITALRRLGDSVSYDRRDNTGDISAHVLAQAQTYLVANMMDRIRQMDHDELSEFVLTRVFEDFHQHAPSAVLVEAKELGWESQ